MALVARHLTPRTGAAVLIRLRDPATRPGDVYTHKWTAGDTLIWDNAGVMHRTTLVGEEPLA